jgi:hypothetical protein
VYIGADNLLYVQFMVQSGTSAATAASLSALSLNTWYHFSAVYDRDGNLSMYINGVFQNSFGIGAYVALDQSTTSVLRMGYKSPAASTATYLNGQIDEFRIYDYARTPAQIAWDYDKGAPVGWYMFDECQGSVLHDSSVNRLDGTIYPGNASGDNDTVGTCNSGVNTEMWNNGTTGRWNVSLDFDGGNDYASVPDDSRLRFDEAVKDFSVFAWVKRADTGATEYVISKEDADDDGWRLLINANDTVTCSVNGIDVTSLATFAETTTWHQIGCSISRSGNGQLYIDGVANGAAVAISSTAMATTSAMTMGMRSYGTTQYFNGLIDDIRIFNYAITPAQIKVIYNNGAVNFD